MLPPYRRLFALAAFILLALPLAVGLIHPDSPTEVLREGRTLAPAPPLPHNREEWLALPGAIDDWLQDHFGLRSAMIRAHRELTKASLNAGSNKVLVGRDGRMFVLGEQSVQQSAGLVLRDKRVAETVKTLSAINGELSRMGIRFLVAIPPNTATVFPGDLPSWAQNKGRSTEYDLLLSGLKAEGVRTVDLRPVMAEARSEPLLYYRHDSHWQPLGALIGYNAIVAADGHPDWRIEPGAALTKSAQRTGGDLARMLGIEDSVREEAQEFALPDPKKELLTSKLFGDFIQTADHPGPTIAIIGDSFTNGHFTPPVLQHAGKVLWLNDEHCAFNWDEIERFRPAEVWWMPTERFLLCDANAWPVGFPEAAR
jgi:hypothetical protein